MNIEAAEYINLILSLPQIILQFRHTSLEHEFLPALVAVQFRRHLHHVAAILSGSHVPFAMQSTVSSRSDSFWVSLSSSAHLHCIFTFRLPAQWYKANQVCVDHTQEHAVAWS
jgi:hypothetical protein